LIIVASVLLQDRTSGYVLQI